MEKKYFGSFLQDQFVNLLLNKKNGTFIEMGSCFPILANNTFLLETSFGWKGIMIEASDEHLDSYKKDRPNSIHIIENALNINYAQLFESHNIPKAIDYLSLDIHENENLNALELLDKQVLNNYKFGCITFEHNFYMHRGRFSTCRERSREILTKRGYTLLFPDIRDSNNHPLEDWYVHPDWINIELINKITENRNLKEQFIMKHTYLGRGNQHSPTTPIALPGSLKCTEAIDLLKEVIE